MGISEVWFVIVEDIECLRNKEFSDVKGWRRRWWTWITWCLSNYRNELSLWLDQLFTFKKILLDVIGCWWRLGYSKITPEPMPIFGKTPKEDLREEICEVFVLFEGWRTRTEPPRLRCFLVSWFLFLRFSVISVMNFMNAKCREIFFAYLHFVFLLFFS